MFHRALWKKSSKIESWGPDTIWRRFNRTRSDLWQLTEFFQKRNMNFWGISIIKVNDLIPEIKSFLNANSISWYKSRETASSLESQIMGRISYSLRGKINWKTNETLLSAFLDSFWKLRILRKYQNSRDNFKFPFSRSTFIKYQAECSHFNLYFFED